VEEIEQWKDYNRVHELQSRNTSSFGNVKSEIAERSERHLSNYAWWQLKPITPTGKNRKDIR
jgi:hypothetical protein